LSRFPKFFFLIERKKIFVRFSCPKDQDENQSANEKKNSKTKQKGINVLADAAAQR